MIDKRQIYYFFGAIIALSAAAGIHESIFNNFLSDQFDIEAVARGWLEFPRELPGLLVVLMAGALAVLPVTRLGLVGGVGLALGLAGMAAFGMTWSPMIAMMLLMSAGAHLLQPVGQSIAIGLSDDHNRGRRLGQMGAIGTIGMILGAGSVWLFLDKVSPQYRTAFVCAAVVAGLSALMFSRMHIPHLHQRRARFVVRRKFWLYYLLEFFFGARKQIFLTFGPWVLIKVYHQPASAIAGLFLTAAVIGIGFKPLSGMAIDRFGERVVLIFDGLVLSVVCLGYGYAMNLTGDAETARLIACGCFILDNLLFALGSGRAIYVSRLTRTPQELTSTLSLGISINHIVSMAIPAAAGAVWVVFGYQKVFLGAAGLALVIAALSSMVNVKKQQA